MNKKSAYIQPEVNVYQLQPVQLLNMSVDTQGNIKNIDMYDDMTQYDDDDLEII